MKFLQWLLSGFTAITIVGILRKIASKVWGQLPAVKKFRKDEKRVEVYLEEQLELYITLECLINSFHSRCGKEIIAFLEEMGIDMDQEKQIRVNQTLLSIMNKMADEVAREERAWEAKEAVRVENQLVEDDPTWIVERSK